MPTSDKSNGRDGGRRKKSKMGVGMARWCVAAAGSESEERNLLVGGWLCAAGCDIDGREKKGENFWNNCIGCLLCGNQN